jgi:hypothetical protein
VVNDDPIAIARSPTALRAQRVLAPSSTNRHQPDHSDEEDPHAAIVSSDRS